VIGGRIQGVGFRPFVCTLANELGVSGSVRNQGGQVEIVARSDPRRRAVPAAGDVRASADRPAGTGF
jgi:hydrogenase maturation factor HypF (carbamoyltransferase family)